MVLMLEYAKGGELFDFVLEEYQRGLPFDEKVAKLQFYQLLSAIGIIEHFIFLKKGS